MIRHDYADVNGVRLHYASAGSGKLILFVHGFPEFWYAWRRQLQEFGRDHLAVAPDTRGYNLSSKPEGVEPLSRQASHRRSARARTAISATRNSCSSRTTGVAPPPGRSPSRIRNAWKNSSSSTRRIPASSCAISQATARSRKQASTCAFFSGQTPREKLSTQQLRDAREVRVRHRLGTKPVQRGRPATHTAKPGRSPARSRRGSTTTAHRRSCRRCLAAAWKSRTSIPPV